MKVKVTTDHFLINFKYPWIARYQCYECPGAYYIDWKKVHWIKTGSTTKEHTASPLEEVIIVAEKAQAKWQKAWLKRYEQEKSYWSN